VERAGAPGERGGDAAGDAALGGRRRSRLSAERVGRGSRAAQRVHRRGGPRAPAARGWAAAAGRGVSGEAVSRAAGQPPRRSAGRRVGLKYRQVLGATGTWGIGGRYDYNRADSSRYQYAGWTASTDLGLPLGSAGRISAYFRYNIRNYSSRMVTVDTGQELRRDADNVAMVTWGQGIAHVSEVVINYRYEHD